MSKTEYRECLEAIGSSQERFADAVGFGRRTSQSYALGETPVHPATAVLLRLMRKLKMKVDDLG